MDNTQVNNLPNGVVMEIIAPKGVLILYNKKHSHCGSTYLGRDMVNCVNCNAHEHNANIIRSFMENHQND